MESFHHWDLGPEIQGAIEEMGIQRPTPIQALAIGPVLEGQDVIAKAETGTGKTLAFGAPIMARIDTDRSTVLALVLCPTRELAQQVASVMTELGKPRGIGVALVVGGDPMHPQVEALRSGAQVVVGTPGRVLDLYNQKFLQFPWTEYVVLDEADEMLEIGFLPDVQKILSFIPEERNTLLFSATFPPALLRLARAETKNPAEIATAKGVATVENIQQSVIHLDGIDRALALIRLIETSEKDDVFLVFCERRTDVDRLMRRLERLPFGIKALHGGYDQAARFRVMSAFRTGEVKALVATDVASRGLDIVHVTHVLNLHPPKDISDYTHRIGRTGRAGREGRAITLVGEDDAHNWRSLKRAMKWNVEEVELPRRGGRLRNSRGDREERDDSRDREQRSSRDREERSSAPASRSRSARDDGDSRGSERGGRRSRRSEEPATERRSRRSSGEGREERPRRRRRREEGDRGASQHDERARRTRDEEADRLARVADKLASNERDVDQRREEPREERTRERAPQSNGGERERQPASRRRGGRRREGSRPDDEREQRPPERAQEGAQEGSGSRAEGEEPRSTRPRRRRRSQRSKSNERPEEKAVDRPADRPDRERQRESRREERSSEAPARESREERPRRRRTTSDGSAPGGSVPGGFGAGL